MATVEDTLFVGQLLDYYAARNRRIGVAAEVPGDAGVPPEMQVGDVNADGWVEWNILPSTLAEKDIVTVEQEFGVQFPPLFRAYLLSRFQLFDQVWSHRHNQQILMTDTPIGKPLTPLRELLSSWRPLIHAGFIPFGQWGDGWGPLCFNSPRRGVDGECPVVWLDHEALIPLGEDVCGCRESVLHLAQPLYNTFREFLLDVFGSD